MSIACHSLSFILTVENVFPCNQTGIIGKPTEMSYKKCGRKDKKTFIYDTPWLNYTDKKHFNKKRHICKNRQM